jgi:ribosomal protein S6--L-glutamate ligase
LIKEDSQLEKILLGRERQNFIIQEYIPNDGDYRLFLVGYRVMAGFKRQRKEEKLILNRSLGSSEVLEKIPGDVVEEAEKAARTLGVQIAGIDLVRDERTKKPVVIEVNQSPEFYVMERRTGKDIAGEIVRFLRESEVVK